MPRLRINADLLGTCGAARYLGVHRSTLTLWRRRGHITPTVVEEGPPKRYKYKTTDLDTFRRRIDYDH